MTLNEHPRYHVVSMRVNDDELSFLREVSRKYKKCISEIVREALYNEYQLQLSCAREYAP